MKTRLNLTIDNHLLISIKNYAKSKDVSISELVESFFKKVTKPARESNIIDLVERLNKPAVDDDADLKDLYYKEQAKKYGI